MCDWKSVVVKLDGFFCLKIQFAQTAFDVLALAQRLRANAVEQDGRVLRQAAATVMTVSHASNAKKFAGDVHRFLNKFLILIRLTLVIHRRWDSG